MRFLLINQFFWPESAGTGHLLTDVARELAALGHEVHVITGSGTYAEPSAEPCPPVHLHRVPSFKFVRSKSGRLLSYGSFYVCAFWRAVLLRRCDVVFTLTTPPLISLIGTLTKLLRGSRHIIWNMDLYPDVAVDVGEIKSGGFLEGIVAALANFSYRHANRIIALGDCMKQRLMRKGIPSDRIAVVHNWADSKHIVPLPRPGDPDSLVLLYSGNLGMAHDTDTIAGAMRELRDDSRLRFLFVGGGIRRAQLAKFVEDEHLSSVSFHGYVIAAKLAEGLATGDIGLVTQRDACCGSVVPSKVYGIMAAGRPFLFIGPAEATPARIIREFNCGWRIACGDVAGLVHLLQWLAANREEVAAAGRRARQALVDNYDRPQGTLNIAAVLGAVSEEASGQHQLTDSTRPREFSVIP